MCKELSVPIIGIGAGPADGQVLVIQDMLGMNNGFKPKFLRQYAELAKVMDEAIKHYIDDVKTGNFPLESESY